MGTGVDLVEFALELLEPAALFIVLFAEEQVAAAVTFRKVVTPWLPFRRP